MSLIDYKKFIGLFIIYGIQIWELKYISIVRQIKNKGGVIKMNLVGSKNDRTRCTLQFISHD